MQHRVGNGVNDAVVIGGHAFVDPHLAPEPLFDEDPGRTVGADDECVVNAAGHVRRGDQKGSQIVAIAEAAGAAIAIAREHSLHPVG